MCLSSAYVRHVHTMHTVHHPCNGAESGHRLLIFCWKCSATPRHDKRRFFLRHCCFFFFFFMTQRSVLSKWFVEFATPVVVTVTTEEAEKISLKNGLLLHELLSAFGHLDNISATTRSVNHQIPVVDPHIRFERVSEVVPKSEAHIEKMLTSSFEAFNVKKLPSSPGEVRQSPPTGWSPVIEQLILRSMAFTEFEMISHPLIFLTVISTADFNPIACMQELTSHQHIPQCYSTGQYDPNIHRVYVLLHDNSNPDTATLDKEMILRQLKSKFSPTHTKMLCINSLPPESPNLQHPDIWEAWRIPMFFPHHAPQTDPDDGDIVVGSRLSMEDFMVLRNFCIELFQHEVLPVYERRVSVLSRIVSEAKKGMRNVFKSFWRKPQAQEVKKGSSRYKYDKIEAQILLLADTAFNMRDYDAALSMYKLVKDDLKADKSVLHIAHVTLMSAACHFMLDPNSRLRNINSCLETLSHVHAISKSESIPLQIHAYYALVMSEILTSNSYSQSPLEAAQILLQAANYLAKPMPLLSALLTEKASYCYLQAGQDRRFSLQIVLTGQRFQSLGAAKPELAVSQQYINHSCVCFAAAMTFHDCCKWGTIKSRMWRSLADKLKESPLQDVSSAESSGAKSNTKQALLLLLHILRAISPTDDTFSGPVAVLDAVNAYHELVHDDTWSGVSVSRGWEMTTTREILLNETSRAFQRSRSISLPVISDEMTVIEDLRIPEIIATSVKIMKPLNGSVNLIPHGSMRKQERLLILMSKQLEVEYTLEKEQKLLNLHRRTSKYGDSEDDKTCKGHLETNPLLLESWADKRLEALAMVQKQFSGAIQSAGVASMQLGNLFSVAVNELVNVSMTISNTLPVELQLSRFKLILSSRTDGEEPDDVDNSFEVDGIDIVLPSGATQDILLTMKPKKLGSFRITGVTYVLGEKIQIVQQINKPGPLLLRTQKQRSERQRGRDESLYFDVVAPAPCVRVIVNNGNAFHVLNGEIFESTIEFKNEGNAPASSICFMFSEPIGAVRCTDDDFFLPFFGQSNTAMRLPDDASIPPGESVVLSAWFRKCEVGQSNVSLMLSYQEPEQQSNRCSFCDFEVNVYSALSMTTSVVGSKTESLSKTIALEILNALNGEAPDLVSQSDYETPSNEDNLLEENSMTVDAVLAVGDIAKPEDLLGAHSPSGDKTIIGSGEKINIFVPVRLHPPTAELALDSNDTIHFNSRWLSSDGKDLNEQDIQTFDMFSYLSFCQAVLAEESDRAEERRRKAELCGEEFTPRTISQVRRSRNSEQPRATPPTSSRGGALRGTNHHLLDVIAAAEVDHNEASLVIAWSCSWRGKLCRGLTIVHNQKLFKSEFSSERNEAKVASKMQESNMQLTAFGRRNLFLESQYAADRLTVTMDAPQSVCWDFRSEGRCPISVSLDLYSNHPDSSILLSVEALEWIDLNTESSSKTSSRSRKRPPVKGLRWEGKSRFVDVVVPPLSSVSLPFLALISREGVYDIKRFRITVSPIGNIDPNTTNVTPFIKLLEGQCLVTVSSPSPNERD